MIWFSFVDLVEWLGHSVSMAWLPIPLDGIGSKVDAISLPSLACPAVLVTAALGRFHLLLVGGFFFAWCPACTCVAATSCSVAPLRGSHSPWLALPAVQCLVGRLGGLTFFVQFSVFACRVAVDVCWCGLLSRNRQFGKRGAPHLEELVTTRAPEVHLPRRILLCAVFFKLVCTTHSRCAFALKAETSERC